MRRIQILGSLIASAAFVASAAPAWAQVTSWNAFNDFYLSPTAAGWTGATSPTVSGSAWGYYMGNVNGLGFPTTTGTFLTASQIYKYSSYDPLGAGGPVYSNSGWAATGGQGFPNYTDNVAWGAPGNLHSSLGSYPTPWFGGAPGLSQNLSDLIWLQSVWLGGGSSEGISSMVTWKAPTSGEYTFSGLFVSADQSTNSASVAIVDSLLGTAPLGRTVLANNSTQSFGFTKSYSAGDVVQFQVGNNFSTGNAVGLQVAVVPEPSTLALAGLGFAAAGLCGLRGRRSR